MTIRRSAPLSALLLITLAACAASEDDPVASDPPATTASPSTTTTAPAVAPGTGSTEQPSSSSPPSAELGDPARVALDDVLGWLADPASLDPERFTPEFLAQVPGDEIIAAFESLGAGTWEATDVTPTETGALTATLTGPGDPLTVQLSVDPAGRLAGLLIEPALADAPTTLAELTQRLRAAGESTAFLRADVAADGTCRAVEELDADRAVPLGSTFKLYVLGAVATAIEEGQLGWDTPVTVRDQLDSLPSGSTHDDPAGTILTVRELAQRMIEISDNTATDHLIDLVGRGAVEAALAVFGHADPAVTLPFPTTRELFIIKGDPDLLARYAAADESARRDLLAGEVGAAPLPDLKEPWTEPRAVLTVEWFASTTDICRALVTLDDLAARPGLEPIGDILSANPGVPVDPAEFTRVLFKGGSEPGVLFGAWMATRPDGSRIVVAGGAADSGTDIDPATIRLLALGLQLD